MNHCLYHKNCVDGTSAAAIVYEQFKDDCQYVSCNYGDKMPIFEGGDHVYIVDFSFPREQLENLSYD